MSSSSIRRPGAASRCSLLGLLFLLFGSVPSVLVALVAVLGPATGSAAGSAVAAPGGLVSAARPLSLVSQSYSVAGTGPFQIEVAVGSTAAGRGSTATGGGGSTAAGGGSTAAGGGGGTAAAGGDTAAAGDALEVTVYGALGSRSAFEQTLSSGQPTTSRLGSTGALPLSSLRVPATAPGQSPTALGQSPTAPGQSPTAAATSGPVYRASVGLVTPAGSTPAPFNGSPVDLGCSTGSCDGVYPAVVTLLGASRQNEIAHFTTFLVHQQPGTGERLRVAVALPVEAPSSPNPSATAGQPQPLPAGQVDRISTLAAGLAAAARSQVPMTIQASPETLQRLAVSGRRGTATLLTLQLLAGDGLDQFLGEPYAPVRPDTLTASGLDPELAAQTARGAAVMAALRLAPSSGSWVPTAPIGGGTRDAVQLMNVHQVVVPEGSLSPEAERLTPANTFTLDLGHGVTVDAAPADGELTRQFPGRHDDPVLAAHQMLADLDLVHEELPNATRGLVAVPPPGWTVEVPFVTTLLRGLTAVSSPGLQAVNLAQYFAQVPPESASGGSPVMRQLSNAPSTTFPGRFVTSLRADRNQWDAFATVAPDAGALVTRLGDALLLSQTAAFTSAQRRQALDGFQQALAVQLHQVQLSTDRSITLTSRNAALPITILSSSPYRMVAQLTLTSDKLQFPSGNSRAVDIDRSTTPLRVDVVARTSGDLPVEINLTSPNGQLTIVHGQLTVRSTATSLAGVVLTVVALAVLLAWWARTWWTSRRRRRAVPPGGADAEPRPGPA